MLCSTVPLQQSDLLPVISQTHIVRLIEKVTIILFVIYLYSKDYLV